MNHVVDFPKDAELRASLARAVNKVCPSWMASQSDDIVQTCMMRVMDKQKKSEGNHQFSSSYLWRMAHNAMIDEIRRIRRRGEVALTDEEREEPRVPTTEADPERRVASRQIGTGIRDCLSNIMETRRRAVTLYLQGHTVPESARLLGWTVKKTENLVYRGLQELRNCLAAKGLAP